MRRSGVLLHISSLPSDCGIGTFGKEAYRFVDFLKAAGQTYWQVLPICPTSYGDSPYQSYSVYAGNPYFIDLDLLRKEGLLKRADYADIDWGKDVSKVDYGIIFNERFKVLKKAYARFLKTADYEDFIRTNAYWLNDYALFMAIREKRGFRPWSEWEDDLKFHRAKAIARFLKKEGELFDFYRFVQYIFYKQWFALKAYANKNGIYIIGDMPIYVAFDSVDVWANSELFRLGKDRIPKAVAGVPGDSFDANGQLWGNPLYRYEKMAKDDYAWFTRRIHHVYSFFDVLRIDHFRGFCAFYSIPYGAKDARDGHWEKGPGIALFRALEKRYGKLSIIAEDLGFITDDVRILLKECGFKGMKVLQFAFDQNDHDSAYLPHNIGKDCVAYSGTHDNSTIEGWLKEMPKDDLEYAKEYMRLNKEEGYRQGVLKTLWATSADLVIMQMQDILGLDGKARMNTPSTNGNWSWRMLKGSVDKRMANRLRKAMELYNRI